MIKSYNNEYIKEAKNKLKDIMHNPSTYTLNKILEWSSWVYAFNKRPHTVYFLILIPTDTKSFLPDPLSIEDINNVNLPISKSLEKELL